MSLDSGRPKLRRFAVPQGQAQYYEHNLSNERLLPGSLGNEFGSSGVTFQPSRKSFTLDQLMSTNRESTKNHVTQPSPP